MTEFGFPFNKSANSMMSDLYIFGLGPIKTFPIRALVLENKVKKSIELNHTPVAVSAFTD